MALVFLDNICVTLTSKLTPTATMLPISPSGKQLLCEKLGADGHSYLTLSTNLGTEIIRVTCGGGEIVAQRAQGGTQAVTGPKDACLCFKVNKLVMDEYMPQDFCQPSIKTDTSDYITITPPEEGKCEWTVNISEEFIERFEACCPEDDCNNCTVADGVYENATITIINGKVCGISNGTNIVYSGGGCCGCGTTAP